MHPSASPASRPRSAGVVARRSPQFHSPKPPPVATCCRPPLPRSPLAIILLHTCVTAVAGAHLALALIRGAALRAPPPSHAHLAPAAAAVVAAAAVAGGTLGEATAAALATIAATLEERDESGRLASAVAAVQAHHAGVREARAQKAAAVDEEGDVEQDAEAVSAAPQPEATTTTAEADAPADLPPSKRPRPSPVINLTVRSGAVSPGLTALELDALAGLAGMEEGGGDATPLVEHQVPA